MRLGAGAAHSGVSAWFVMRNRSCSSLGNLFDERYNPEPVRGRAEMIRSTAVLAFLLAGVTLSAPLARAEDAGAPTPKRLTFGAEAVASIATDDPGYFNDTSYGRSAMRLARLRLDVSLRLGGRAAVLVEGRADNGEGLTLAALYLRLRPFPARAFDVQVGRIPPVFGALARRTYGVDNPLIGSPLAYQYLTSLRSDSLPATADDLLGMRGRGWRTRYTIGSTVWDRGLPVIAGDRWDTGVEVRVGVEPVSLTAALTQGTLSDPRVEDDNDGKQIAARVEVRPALGLVLGASASRGEYLTREAGRALPTPPLVESYRQEGLGVDLEYARGYWLIRSETVLSRWAIPQVQRPLLTDTLGAWGTFVEARYKIRPGLYTAARVDHLGFSRIAGTLFEGRPTTWDAPVTRVEAGAGYSFRRNLLLKIAVQRNWRTGVSFGARESVAGAQVLLWF
jgi:hypothetical protein